MKLQLVFTVVVCLFAASLSAQTTSATLYLSGQFNAGSSRFLDDEPTLTSNFDTGSGYGLAVSTMFGERLSGELAVFRLSSSGEVRENGTKVLDLGDLDLTPVTAMLRYHFRPRQRVDFYLGAGVARVLADDLDSPDLRLEGLAPLEVEDETTAAIGGGLIVALSPRWGIVIDARYLPFDVTGTAGGQSAKAQLDPLIVSAGVRIQF